MTPYKVATLPRAAKQLQTVPFPDYARIRDAIRNLGNEPRPRGSGKLRGRDGWRIRVGRYRVLFTIDDAQQTIVVRDVGHRRDIYR